MSWDMSVGSEFAGYRIKSVLGRGGMSVVYAAEHVRLGRMVALKVLSPALAADETFRERFIRESQLAASLDHPNIISIYDAGEANGFLYIAMRHVEGHDLGSLIEREGPLSLGQTLFVMEQVAGALDQAHEKGLVHRDVKPANILIARPSDRVYLTDFGVVKQTSSRGLTKTGYFLGTFEYAAPEQIEGKAVDGRTDVYALGCVLYECLSGEAPFTAETEGSVIHAHLVEPPPKLTAKRPELPHAINDVIATAMAKSRDDRYPTGTDLVRAFRGVAMGTVAGERAVPPAPPTVQGAPATIFANPGDGSGGGPSTEGPPAEAPPPGGPPSEWLPAPPSGGPGDGGPRTVTLPARRLWGIAAVLALLIAGGVVAAILLTGGDNKKKTAATGTAPTTAGTAGGSTAVGLAGVVPNEILKHCKTVTAQLGAAETATCTPPANAGNTFFPDTWDLSLYPSTTAVLKAYNKIRADHGVGKDFGRCDRTSWSGEGAWLHNPLGGAPPAPGGRRFCYFDGNLAVVVWTHEKLGQASHIDLLGIARAGGQNHFDLFSWWAFWHHKLGKCSEPNCTAKLS